MESKNHENKENTITKNSSNNNSNNNFINNENKENHENKENNTMLPTSLEINPKKCSKVKLLSDDLKPKNIWAYGIGHFFNDLCASIWFFFLSYYLIQIIGLEEHKASYVLLWGQVADALATPLVGVLSDKFTSRFGKRFPWYFGGTVLVTVSFALIFYCILPPNSTENAKVLYYSFFAALFNIGWAAVQVSHMALLPSITLDTRKKDLMTKIRTGFTFFAQTLALVFSFFYFSYIKNKIFQYQALAGCCIIIGLFSSVCFLLNCKEWVLSKNIPKYFDNILVVLGKKSRINNFEENDNSATNDNKANNYNEINYVEILKQQEQQKLKSHRNYESDCLNNKNDCDFEEKIEKKIKNDNHNLNNIIHNAKAEDIFDYKKLENDECAVIYKNQKVSNDINVYSRRIDNSAFDKTKNVLFNNENDCKKKKLNLNANLAKAKFEDEKNSEISCYEEDLNAFEDIKTNNNSNNFEANLKSNQHNKSNADTSSFNKTKFAAGKAYFQEDRDIIYNNNNSNNKNTNYSNSHKTNGFLKNSNNNKTNDLLEFESNHCIENCEANYNIEENINNNENMNKKINNNHSHQEKNHQEKNLCAKKPKKEIDWVYWLKKPDFYFYIFVYMFVRLSINITSIVIPFYMEFVLKYSKSSEGGTPYEITVCLLISTLGSIFNSIYFQKFFEVDTKTVEKNNNFNSNNNDKNIVNNNSNFNNISLYNSNNEFTNNNNNNNNDNYNNSYNTFSKFAQLEETYYSTTKSLLTIKKREMEIAKRNKRLYLILVSLFFISIGCLPLFILNASVKNTIFFLSFLWGIGFSQALSCVSSLTNDVVGKNGSKGAFVYGAFSFADKLSCGIVLVFYLPLANNNEYFLRCSIPFFPPAAVFFGTLFIFVKIFLSNKKFKEDSELEINSSYKLVKDDDDCSNDEISIENYDENDNEEVQLLEDKAENSNNTQTNFTSSPNLGKNNTNNKDKEVLNN